MEDARLIHEFVTDNSERAFHDLVNRHLNLVHSVAFRQLRDAQLAEEVTQAVFMLLARKAGTLHENIILAGWLYRTTRFVAARALRAEQRRQRREQEAFQMQQISSSDDTWKRLAPVLDEGIDQLAQVDRDAVVLRFLQAEPFHKVGTTLGISEEAARKRVNRSLEKLRSFFARRGVALTTAVLAAALAEHSAEAAPVTLGKIVAAKALARAAVGTALLPALVKETLASWSWAKVKLAVGLGASVGIAACLLVNGVTGAKHGNPISANGNNKTPSNPLAANSTANAAPVSATNTGHFIFQAVDDRTGRGVAGARVFAITAQDQDHINTLTNLLTDSEGRCEVPLSFTNVMLAAVGALADGYEQRCAAFFGRDPIPAQYVLKLPRGSRIGGVVQNEAGDPVANASIYVQFFGTGDSSTREFQRERPGFPADDLPIAKTDRTGHWTFGSAPETNGDFLINVKHPDFPVAAFQNDAAENGVMLANRLKLEDLHAGNAVLILKHGLGVRGVVTDEQNNPISGATVRFGELAQSGNPETQTGVNGSFALNSLAAGAGHITVTARNYAPERMQVDISANTPAMTIQLKPGGLLRLLVVDETGGGVAHARVQLQGWRGNNSLDWGGFTDYQGHIEWDSAPHDQMDLCVIKEGFFYSRENMIVADGVEHTITLRRRLTVSGVATDADTKQPIASFKAISGSEGSYWDRSTLAHGTNGQYQLIFEEYRTPFQIRFEADGYESAISTPLNQNATNLTYDVQLKKADTNNAVRGTVLLPDGSPAAGAQVALCTSEKGVTLGQAKFINRDDSIVVDADAEGRFTFPPALAPQTVIAVHSQGFASSPLDSTNHVISIQLEPWGRIEGILKRRNQTVADQQIKVSHQPITVNNEVRAFSLDMGAFSTKTDEQGNFVFEQVPPCDLTLYLVRGIGIPFSHQTPVQVQPGETLRAQLGGTGRTLKGQLVCSDASRPVDWSKQMGFAALATKLPSLPPGLKGPDAQKWWMEFWQSEEGRARTRALRSFPLDIQADGSFTIEDVIPGDYQLRGQLHNAPFDPPNRSAPAIGSIQKEVTVPDSAGNPSADPLDIGTVVVKIHGR